MLQEPIENSNSGKFNLARARIVNHQSQEVTEAINRFFEKK